MVERAFSSEYSSMCAQVVLRDLFHHYYTIRKILSYIIKWYLDNIYVVEALNPAHPDTQTEFERMFLVRIAVDNAWPRNIFGIGPGAFILYMAVNHQNSLTWGI